MSVGDASYVNAGTGEWHIITLEQICTVSIHERQNGSDGNAASLLFVVSMREMHAK